MDTSQCDSPTRSLTMRTRRRFSRALAALGLAGGLGMLALADEAAGKKKCRRKRKGKGKRCKIVDKPKCGSGEKPCFKSCIPEGDCCADDDCDSGGGFICVDGECVCGSRRGVSAQLC